MDITEHRISSERHSTFYRACGPEDGPLIIMTHGWPELSISWRHQLSYLGGLGYRAIAPDMRGYGGSSLYTEHEAYVQREICLLYTSPSPRDSNLSRMPSSA